MSDLAIFWRWTFSTSSIVNKGVALDSTCMFEAMFKKFCDSKTFFLANLTCKNKMLIGERALFRTRNRFYINQSGLKETG